MHPKLQAIFDTIITDLQAGRRPWKPPYKGGQGGLPVRVTGEGYRGSNVILLWMAGMMKGYSSPLWMTYGQARQLGGFVRKGERSSPIIFTKTATAKDEDGPGEGEGEERSYRFMKVYPGFNVAQIDNLPDRFYGLDDQAQLDEAERLAMADRFIANTGAEIEHVAGAVPCYMPAIDRIRMPLFRQFNKAGDYYGTATHELAHRTGAPARLNRQFGARFGDHAYAQEELVAELTSVFTCAALGVEVDLPNQVVPYLGHWADRIKADHRVLLSAAADAQKAKDLLFSTQAEDDLIAWGEKVPGLEPAPA